jgi:TolB-like protein/Flp pilus assembly protein TadD
LIVFAVAAIAFAVARGRVTPSAPPAITSLVVLPLENLSGDPARAYLAAGLTEELTSRLAQLRALRVVSRTSAMAFEGRRVSLPAIGRELQVDAAIEGTVRYQDGRVRVSIQLVHTSTDAHLWARDFERDAADLLQLQRDIAAAIADEVRVQIRPDERAELASVPTVNPRAHEEYLLGRYLLWKGVEKDRVLAIEHFDRAISIAPDYAAPFAALAHAWWMRSAFGQLTLREVASPARDAAREALARDDRLAEAYAAKAYVQGMFDWDWAGAEATIQRAVQLEPNSADAHYVFAILLMAMGRLEEARVQIAHAARVDPLSAQVQSTFGRILYRARQFDAALERLNRAIELEPRNGMAYRRLADVYALMGRYDEALRLYEQAGGLVGGAKKTVYDTRIALTYARMGRGRDARRLLPDLQGPAGALATVHTALGDHDTAFTLLFHAVDAREDLFPFIKADPDFDALHADHRWN